MVVLEHEFELFRDKLITKNAKEKKRLQTIEPLDCGGCSVRIIVSNCCLSFRSACVTIFE